MPLTLAGLKIDTNQGLAKQIVPRPVPTVEIACRGFDREIHKPELFVNADLRPHARIAGVFGGAIQPRVIAELAFFGNGMEYPKALARPNVESADVPFVVPHALGCKAFPKSRAHDHRVASHDRRRMKSYFPSDYIRLDGLIVI